MEPKKIGTTPEDLARKIPGAYQPPKLDKVDVPPEPELNPQVSIWEKLAAVFVGWINTLVKKSANGEPISIPSFELPNVKIVAISIVIIGILILLFRACPA